MSSRHVLPGYALPARFVLLVTLAVLCSLSPCAAAPSGSVLKNYTQDWESLNSRPTPQWFTDAKFGIFIHWGVYSVPAWAVRGKGSQAYSEWYWKRMTDPPPAGNPAFKAFHQTNYGANFSYMDFAPQFRAELFDADAWAKILADSGAKYIALTSKHHDGFCLWPSAEANKAWGRPWNSVDIGPKRDLVGELTAAGRKQGLKMGLYYSLYEWYNPLWLTNRSKYVTEHMHPQFKDVVSRYSPSIIFSDGEWDMPSSDWRSTELLAWLFNESPCREEVVINDRWGKGERHKNGGYFTTEYGAGLPRGTHPWEECRGMGRSFGFSRNEQLEDYCTGRELVWMLADLVSRGGNLLLDIGPAADGTIPVIMQDRLAQMGAWLKVNGEAIYGTTPWNETCQWSEGVRPDAETKRDQANYDITKLAGLTPVDGKARKQVFFTAKPNTLYAILPYWPGKSFTLRNVSLGGSPKATLLGNAGVLPCRVSGENLEIELPPLHVDQMPCRDAWTLKITR